jgi:hypothetical protein
VTIVKRIFHSYFHNRVENLCDRLARKMCSQTISRRNDIKRTPYEAARDCPQQEEGGQEEIFEGSLPKISEATKALCAGATGVSHLSCDVAGDVRCDG